RWDAGSTDPMKPVAASDEVAFERAFLSPQPKAHPRRIGVEVVDGDCVNLKVQGLACGQSSSNQVFDHLLLPVDHDSATGQLLKVQSMSATGEVEAEALVLQALFHHARTDAGPVKDIHALVLEDAGPYAFFHVVLALGFQHDAFDTMLM